MLAPSDILWPVLDSTWKLSYLEAVWESDWIDAGREHIKKIVSLLSSPPVRLKLNMW